MSLERNKNSQSFFLKVASAWPGHTHVEVPAAPWWAQGYGLELSSETVFIIRVKTAHECCPLPFLFFKSQHQKPEILQEELGPKHKLTQKVSINTD